MRKIYPSAIWRIPIKEKKIFLTFDDGPIPEITPWVLGQLKKYNSKATFFCIGANIDKYPDIFYEIISHGHSVGNHTYNHLNGWKVSTKEYFKNARLCELTMNALNKNQEEKLFRPPYGKMKICQYSLLKTKYSLIMWDVLSGDFDQTISEEMCLSNVLNKTREGSIVVFHDSLKAEKNLFYTLPKFLDHFCKIGFEFNSLPFSANIK